MSTKQIRFRKKDNFDFEKTDITCKELSGHLSNRKIPNINFSFCTFNNLSLKNADISKSILTDVIIQKADFRGTNLSGIDLLFVRHLHKAKFNDNTIVEDIDFEKLAIKYPLLAFKLKQIKYAGNLKRAHPRYYWLWQISCKCGRSWILFFGWGLFISAIFSMLYFLGTIGSCSYLPSLDLTAFASAGTEPMNQKHVFAYCTQFSFMTFVSFNMQEVVWSNLYTGFWVALESWIGLAYIGTFITLIATKVAARNEG